MLELFFPKGIFTVFVVCLESIKIFDILFFEDYGFFNYFTLSAYLNVFSVCYQHVYVGETFAIIKVLQFDPKKLSFKTIVNLLPLNGRCLCY